MIISFSRKYIFIHVPKNMGSSLHTLLAKELCPVDIQLGVSDFGEKIQSHYRDSIGLHKHSFGFEVRDVLGDNFYRTFSIFACIRDPVDRLLSAYYFLKSREADSWWRGSNDESNIKRIFAFNNINDFVESNIWREARIISNIFAPQVDFLLDKNGEWLADYLILADRAQSDVNELFSELGFQSSEVPWFNETPRIAGEVLRSELLDEVRNYYSADINLYDSLKRSDSLFRLTKSNRLLYETVN